MKNEKSSCCDLGLWKIWQIVSTYLSNSNCDQDRYHINSGLIRLSHSTWTFISLIGQIHTISQINQRSRFSRKSVHSDFKNFRKKSTSLGMIRMILWVIESKVDINSCLIRAMESWTMSLLRSTSLHLWVYAIWIVIVLKWALFLDCLVTVLTYLVNIIYWHDN